MPEENYKISFDEKDQALGLPEHIDSGEATQVGYQLLDSCQQLHEQILNVPGAAVAREVLGPLYERAQRMNAVAKRLILINGCEEISEAAEYLLGKPKN